MFFLGLSEVFLRFFVFFPGFPRVLYGVLWFFIILLVFLGMAAGENHYDVDR